MKKALITAAASSLALVSAYALPTYEPFTESAFTTAIAASSSNCVDLCTGGFTAPGGEVWGNLTFSGAPGTASSTNGNHGIDILVTNNSSSVFTATTLANLLPATFPGFPASGQSIKYVLMNPAQPAQNASIVGNSAVLRFAQDITRPATGTKTFYISYLFSLVQKGQLGVGNDCRYLDFVASSNLVEGVGSGGYYTTWASMLDAMLNAGGTCHYFSHAAIQGGSGYYTLACDPSTGKEFTTGTTSAAFNVAEFVVGEYTMSATGSDANTVWINPAISTFGGPTPPATSLFTDTMPYQMSDIGGMVVDDRVGSGASAGGIGSNYMANILLGSTWSYVTGGPEFTTQPATNNLTQPGGSVTLNGIAVAGGQSVNYQWQKNGVTVNNGAGGAGGAATVSGATTSTLSLSGVNMNDAGTYALVATASGTGYSLPSANAVVTVADPGILNQPVSAAANYGGAASFTATAVTSTSQLTYAWYFGSTMLVNGTQADGSVVSGAQGTNSGGTANLTLNLANVGCGEDGSYSLVVTNLSGNTASSTSATLTVTDPYIVVQPPATGEFANGGTVVIPVTAGGTGLTYQWNWQNGNGADVNNGEILGATTSALTISPATANDAGTYSVTLTGTCSGGQQVVSSNTVVYMDTAPTSLTVSPPKQVQQVGTHLAFVATVSGGSGVFHLLAKQGSTYLNTGLQSDSTTLYGPGSLLIQTNLGALVISNLHLPDSGTYTIIASNAAGMVSASSVLQVVPQGQLTLSSANLIVTRIGDGYEPLSGATGNTLYLDQFTTAGAYVSTIMVPDSGSNAVIVAGAGISPTENEGIVEGYLTLSSNQQYLNFGGFCYSYPYGGSDVTIGQQHGGGVEAIRGIYALNAYGTMALVYTNYGLYSGANGFRDVYSTDGLTNFWTTGSASGGTVKYVNAGPAGAAYTITSPGSGIPALGGTGQNMGGICLGLIGTNLAFSEHSADGDTGANLYGIDEFNVGFPEVANTNDSQILVGGDENPCDFAVSPDGNTLYLADDGIASAYGGIQRYDLISGQWQYAYYLQDTTTAGNTNGMRGMCVYWPPNITSWGQGVTGATIYATTTEASGDRIVSLLDNGDPGTTPATEAVLETAQPNTFFRGIRFGPVSVPEGATIHAATNSIEVGDSLDLSATVQGVFTYYFPNVAGTGYNLLSPIPTTYQWYSNGVVVPGATGYTYGITNAQLADAGTYSFVVSNDVFTPVTNSLVLSVTPFGISSNLVGWWLLNDGSGATAVDSSVYHDNGTLQGFPGDNSEWVSGLDNAGALNYANVDGTNDNVVVVPDEPQLNFSNNLAFTISAWIESEFTPQTNGAAIVTKGYGNGGESYDFDLYAGKLRFFVRSATGVVTPINSSYTPPSNQWVHVAATFDGMGGFMGLYANGQLIGSNTAPNSLLYTTTNVSIGNRTPSNTNGYLFNFFGKMQDVRIYDASLDAQEISSVYLSGNLAIAASPPSASAPTFVAANQAQINFSGVPNTTYKLWSTTNVALIPVQSTWTLVTTGTFDSNGLASFTDLNASGTTKFYTITQP